MPVDDAPEDDEVRETYNFAPGYYGIVYRAVVPFYGAEGRNYEERDNVEPQDTGHPKEQPMETKYKLQAMKWGMANSWMR